MNKKIFFCNESNEVFYCILSGEKNLEEQLNRLVYGDEHPRHGLCVRLNDDTLDFVDYYHDERMAYHRILRIEDTDEALSAVFLNREQEN